MNGHHCHNAAPGAGRERPQAGCSERRAHGERRRNADGLFEKRARREGVGGDRRRQPRVAAVARRRLRGLWRFVKPYRTAGY